MQRAHSTVDIGEFFGGKTYEQMPFVSLPLFRRAPGAHWIHGAGKMAGRLVRRLRRPDGTKEKSLQGTCFHLALIIGAVTD